MNAIPLIAILSRLLCSVPLAPPSNDECAGAIEIAGEGQFSFLNTEATSSDILTECQDFPYFGDSNFSADVWYCWTAECTGFVTIDTCGSTVADTKIGIYEGCGCSAESFLTCGDNGCATQSKVEFLATAGTEYGIRIGSAPGFSGSSDTFAIACRTYGSEDSSMCNYLANPATLSPICKSRSGWDVLNSSRGAYTIVEDFVPEISGAIHTACWAGAYLKGGQECIRHSADEFEITYYIDDCGGPGAIVAGPFSADHYTLTVVGPAMTHVELPGGAQEFEYGAQHEAVEVTGGQTYWVSITNSPEGDCEWYWETSPGNSGYAVQANESNHSTAVVQNDLSFCFDVEHMDVPFCSTATVPNDTCESAIPLFPGIFGFDTTGAMSADSLRSAPLPGRRESMQRVYNDDFPLGDDPVHKDIWFDLSYPCSGKARISVCQSTFDTKLAVYRDTSCFPSNLVALSDDDCGFENLRSVVEISVSNNDPYKVQVGGYEGSWGTGVLEFQYVVPDHPTLLDFASLSRCFTGSCTPPCSLFPMDCCETQDFDADADVDLNDAGSLLDALSGPQ